MGKISLINIAEELAAKSGLGKDVTDNFLHAFIETIEKGLNEDNLVKVKGLGTFKLMEVSDRGSVDVNTGERITIKGHTKVSFTPDNAMKEFVNRPFAHFEPTELNEGYSEEDLIDSPSCMEAEENEAVAADVPSVEAITVDADTPSVALHEEITDRATEVVQTDEQEVHATEVVENSSLNEAFESTNEAAIVIESTDAKEAAAIVEETIDIVASIDVQDSSEIQFDDAAIEEASEESISEVESVTEAVVEIDCRAEHSEFEAEPMPADAETGVAEETAAPSDLQSVADVVVEEPQSVAPHSKLRLRWSLGALIMVLVAGVYYYVSTEKMNSDGSEAIMDEVSSIMVRSDLEEELGAELNEVSEVALSAVVPAPVDTVASVKEIVPATESQPIDSKPVTLPTSMPTVTPAAIVITESLAAKNIKDITPADTTDYLIAGTQSTHTLQSGETIIQLARKYYGDKRLWPYIVKYNHITDFNKVGVGMEIKIPVLKAKTGE